MKNRIAIFTVAIFLFYSISSISQTIDIKWIKWEDTMNGNNSVAGLQSRGWIVLNEDGGGVTAPWFQGGTQFLAFDGPDTGYVASNYNGANIDGVIDQWMISPALTVTSADTLIFWARAPLGGAESFDDSINIMYSASAGTTPSAFVSIGRFLVPTNDWDDFYIINFPSNATIRFAIRYYLFEGGPTGIRSNYIGLDEFQLFTSSLSYPSTISISKSFGFTNITQSSSYRMIGLPGDLNLPLSPLISGIRETDWNAYHDNGATSNYLVEYDGSANFNFTPGHGFWLLSKNAVNVNVVVNSVSLAGNQTYSIPLRTGWNIISNPFERSSNWSAVQTANGLGTNDLLYDWVGSWNNSATFVPYKGYYFNNITGLTSLIIPYDPNGTLGKTIGEREFQISSENDIKFSLLKGDHEKSKIFIGFSSESTDDFDVQDYFAPPGDFEEARIVIRNDGLSIAHKYLMKESRSEIGSGQMYELEVKNVTEQELVLTINELDNYEGYLAYLIDKRLNNEIKLSNDSEIIIPANVSNNNYTLIIGTQQFIDEKIDNLIPTEFSLFQNYPNPFNPTTIIRYSVPTAVLVNINIYDILGNEMMTLLNEIKAPGNYEINFDGVQFASGVYIYKIQAGNYTENKKMVLLR